jgi:hypothetical protein
MSGPARRLEAATPASAGGGTDAAARSAAAMTAEAGAQPNALPPGPMNQTIQLDWFPDATKAGAMMEVDWVTIYRL